MIKVKNLTNTLQTVRFTNGNTKYLLKGETFVSKHKVEKRTSGVSVIEFDPEPPKVQTTSKKTKVSKE